LPFSSLMFFERRTQSSIKHRRLRYLLLLSLRVALLLLMALAFANPFINRTGLAYSGRRLVVLAVDNSFSMHYGDHLAHAKQDALNALSSLHSGELAQVLALNSKVNVLTQPTDDVGALRAAIGSIDFSDERSSYGEFARVLRTISQTARVPLEVHLFSDMQKSSLPPAFADLRLAEATGLNLHPVNEAKEPNWVVESVTEPGRIYDPKKVRVEAVIAGYGTDAAKKTVSLVLDNKVLESKPVDVPANGRASVEFLALESPYGFHKGEIRIEPNDSLREDDRFPFSVERTDPRRVLFLHEGGQGRALLYYKTALESAVNAGFIVDPLAVDQAANQSLSKYSLVVLSDVGALPAGLEDILRAYVRAGGALLVSLGPSSTALAKVPVSGEAISGSAYASREGARFQLVGAIDPQHPAVHNANKLEAVQFYQAVKVDPGQSHVIARLTDQTPLLLEKQVGEGRVFTFTSTFDNVSNDFPLHTSFLPFVEQSARYLSSDQERATNVEAGSYIDLRTAKDQGTSVEVIDPDGKRPLSLKESTSAQTFPVTREGFYEIHRANGRQELVAVHANRRESDLTPIPAETLDLWRNTGKAAPASDGSAGADSGARPWSLWRYFLALVLIAAIIESFFASRYLTMEQETA
ncbi:MAG TPA: VWA domain-containing protein, partial [Bryobacteraceae bacterium]|nr:VWA domain-containing protein [Bryobacteraceae bacterium]